MRIAEYIPSGEGEQVSFIGTAGTPGGGLLAAAGPDTALVTGPPGPDGRRGAESDLIDQVRAGDPEAMAVLYERYREPGLRFISRLMNGTQEAEDVFQEGFAKAVAAIRNGAGPTDVFAPYLNTCIRSVANTFWMKQAREQPAPDEDLDPGPLEDPRLETALSLFEHEQVVRAMRSLPVRWRTVLWHAEILGAPPRDIGVAMGISANAVSALLIRARTALRTAYEEPALPGPGGAAGE